MRNVLIKIFILICLIFFSTAVYAVESSVVPESVKDFIDSIHNSPVILITNQNGWQVLDTTTSAGLEPNDLTAATGTGGYGGRTYLSVVNDANTGAAEVNSVIIPCTWNGARIRCVGITADLTVTYQVYGGSLPVLAGGKVDTTANCALDYYGQLVFTVGTQLSDIATYYFADQITITDTNRDHTASWTVTSSDDNRIAECRIDLLGDNVLVLVPTICNVNCKLLGKGC
ncbi:MAG: hypothetical protein PHG53_09540 [Phycisphaerae bacterium]|nr:hypothetical protein [Phycisphaerae bacterium]